MNPKKWAHLGYSPAELAEVLGCSKLTILRAYKRGLIPGVRLNARVIRFPPNRVREIMNIIARKSNGKLVLT